MIPYIYPARNEFTSPRFCAAFAQACGGQMVEQYMPGPWAGFGSPQNWEYLLRAIREGHDFYYGDHAYFGRGKFFRVTKNAFQHRGIGKPDFDRLKRFLDMPRAWKKGGRNIILCPQSGNHHQRFGETAWIERMMHTLSVFTDRPIVVRTKQTRKPLVADLDDAHCLVTHSSNAAVEAVLHGIPVFTTSNCAASIMGLSDPTLVEHPIYPDGRHEWAGVLAANQWTLQEIRSGLCWDKLMKEKS